MFKKFIFAILTPVFLFGMTACGEETKINAQPKQKVPFEFINSKVKENHKELNELLFLKAYLLDNVFRTFCLGPCQGEGIVEERNEYYLKNKNTTEIYTALDSLSLLGAVNNYIDILTDQYPESTGYSYKILDIEGYSRYKHRDADIIRVIAHNELLERTGSGFYGNQKLTTSEENLKKVHGMDYAKTLSKEDLFYFLNNNGSKMLEVMSMIRYTDISILESLRLEGLNAYRVYKEGVKSSALYTAYLAEDIISLYHNLSEKEKVSANGMSEIQAPANIEKLLSAAKVVQQSINEEAFL